MKRSAALTLAHKFKKKTAQWAFFEFGSKLIVVNPKNKNDIKLLLPIMDEHRFNDIKFNHLFVAPKSVSLIISLNIVCSGKELNCAIPSCIFKAKKWYSSNSRKHLKRNSLERVISTYSVKKIFLCLNHYNLVYSGKYDNSSL